ncbi:MAG TPA: thiamine-phosphate kinase [Candidatus Eisenbacteria bacterium]|nr:thiamine-phosphate kinase [Candidatus Eisenbacteria bacterium]
MPSLRELGEFEVLDRLKAERASASAVTLGPGDDAAVVEPAAGMELVLTTDAFVEGVHYLPAWSAPLEVGARLGCANLSDLAAMAARPRWALLSIGAREDASVDDLVEVQRGIQRVLGRHGAGVVGGNLTSVAGPQWLSLTLLGDVGKGRAWRRSGARAGDRLAVTGHPGRAGAGLALARRLGERARAPEWQTLVAAWLHPEPRVALARELGDHGGVTGAIDISDGLAGDLAKLCEASGIGARLMARDWAMDPEIERAAEALGVDPVTLRLSPSDDYELLLAIDPERAASCQAVAAASGVAFAWIGLLTADRGSIAIEDASGAARTIVERGFDSFEPRGA